MSSPTADLERPDAIAAVARVRRARRIPVLWIIPIVALLIAGWLAWDTYSKRGPTLTISFQSGEGLVAGQSQLKYKELTLGTVSSLNLTPDHTRVVATVSTVREAEPLLNDQTVFWVVRPRLFAGNLSGLGTLLSGSYIGMKPGDSAGTVKRDFVGLEDPPVLQTNVPGRTFLVNAQRLGSINLGSPVFFRDLEVGQVLGWELGDMAEHAVIHVFVRAPFDQYVRAQSHFWNASGVSLKLSGGDISLQMESVRALLLGGIAFDTPEESRDGPDVAENTSFPLFASRQEANDSVYGRRVRFVADFPGSVRGLSPGAEVTFHGLKVGEVTDVALSFDKARNDIVAPVSFVIEPERIVGVGKHAYSTPAEGLRLLYAEGLHATLQSASLITGQMLVALELDKNAPMGQVEMRGDAFVMPTTGAGSFSDLSAAATELLNKVNTMPFKAIGDSLAATLASVQDVTNGPQLKQVVESLTSSLVSVQTLLKNADRGAAPFMAKLPAIATNLQTTLTSANKLVMSMDDGYGDNTKFNRDLDRLLVQLDSAVQSIRALADLLSRHPEALVRGRTDTGAE